MLRSTGSTCTVTPDTAKLEEHFRCCFVVYYMGLMVTEGVMVAYMVCFTYTLNIVLWLRMDWASLPGDV